MSNQPSTDPVLDLYVKYAEFGYVVVGVESIGHFYGPRAAAESAALRTFPKGFKLTVIVPGHHYTAEAK